MDQGSSGVCRVLNGASPPREEDSGSDRSSSDSVSTMSSDEIESHFVERYGRRFHSSGNGCLGLYPFPVDELEGQRLDLTHELVKELLGGRNYRGPVQQTLARPSGARRVRVLDVGTGNGRWVEEMADNFPHAKVYGLDIVPLATRYPADNVQFEVHDINSATRWAQGRFDMVHLRQAFLSPMSYPVVLREIARILRPRGLFLACEWIPGIFEMDGSDPPQLTEHVTELFSHLRELAIRHHLFFDSARISNMLTETTLYEQIATERYLVALDGTSRGLHAKQSLLDLGDAARYLFLNNGFSSSQTEDILATLHATLNNTDGIHLVYQTVYAKRRASI